VCVRNGYCHSRMLPTVRRLLTNRISRIEFSNRPRNPSFFSFFFPDSLFPSLCVCYLTHQQTIEGGGGGGGKKFPLPSCVYVCVCQMGEEGLAAGQMGEGGYIGGGGSRLIFRTRFLFLFDRGGACVYTKV
jgi:hypothetical protein